MKEKLFIRSGQLVKLLGEIMSDIHEEYPGKDKSVLRENLLKPYRDCCVKLHYARIEYVKNMHKGIK